MFSLKWIAQGSVAANSCHFCNFVFHHYWFDAHHILPVIFIKQVCKTKRVFGNLVFVFSFAGPNEIDKIEVLAGLGKVLAQDHLPVRTMGSQGQPLLQKTGFQNPFQSLARNPKAEMVITVINIIAVNRVSFACNQFVWMHWKYWNKTCWWWYILVTLQLFIAFAAVLLLQVYICIYNPIDLIWLEPEMKIEPLGSFSQISMGMALCCTLFVARLPDTFNRCQMWETIPSCKKP